MLSWLLEQGAPWNESVCTEAAEGGSLEALQRLRERGCPWDEDCCTRAAEEEHWHVLMWARAHGCDWDEDHCLRRVDDFGHGGRFIPSTFAESLETLQWMREHQGVWDERICQYAVEYDKPEVLQWAKANNCPGAENY
jgi:hypothetical protein